MDKKFLLPIILIFTFLIQTTSSIKSQSWADLNAQRVKFTEAKNYKKAIEFAEKAKTLANKEFGTDHNYYVTACYNLAKLYHKIKNYKKAEILYTETKEKFEINWGTENASFASLCNNFGSLYLDMGNYPMAEQLYIEEKSIKERVLGKQHTSYAGSCNNLASLYSDIGKYQKAEGLYIEAKKITENLYGRKHRKYIIVCNNLATLYSDIGNYNKAELLYVESKTLNESLFGKKHAEYAISCNNLAELYSIVGEYQKAGLLFIEAKSVIEKTLGIENAHYATICGNLAGLYKKTGNYQKAEQLYLEAKKIDEAVYGKQHASYATSCNNFAELYVFMGNYPKAEKLYLESKKISENVFGKESSEYATSCNNLAALYKNMSGSTKIFNNKANALAKIGQLLIEAKNIYDKIYGKNHINYANACNNLALIYSEIGDLAKNPKQRQEYYRKAEYLYLETKNIFDKALGKQHPDYATSCSNLAELYRIIGNSVKLPGQKNEYYKRAKPLYIEALKIYEKTYGKKYYKYASTCTNLAFLHIAEGNFYKSSNERENVYRKAEKYYLEANLTMNFISQESAKFMSEKERGDYLDRKNNYYFDIYHSFFLHKRQKNKQLVGLVYNNALSLKGQLLQSSIAMRKKVLQSGDIESINAYRKMTDYGKILAQQYTLPLLKRRPDINELEEKLNSLEKRLIGKSQNFAKVNWQNIRKTLKKDETAIEFIRFKYHNGEKWTNDILYYALLLRNNYVYPKAVFLFKEKQLQTLLNQQQNEDDFSYVKRLYSASSMQSQALYKMVFKPLEPHLKNTKTIFVSPTGLLNKIAFDALTCDSFNILSDKYRILYTSSTRQIKNETGLSAKNINNAALFGGIEYDISPEKMLANANSFNKITDPAGFKNPPGLKRLRSLDSLTRNVSWSYLPGSLAETEGIQKILAKKKIAVELFKDELGSEEQFKALENNSPSIVHVSTHGFYFGNDEKSLAYKDLIYKDVKFAHSENPLLRSGFILAGGNAVFQGKNIPDGVDDGVLTAAEISQLNFFNTKLLVLSACQTGLGDVKGNEGVYGLQRAFKMAGVDYLLFSLWEVPDYQTRELMVEFYKNWFEGSGVRDAFRKAQNHLKTKYAKVEGAAFTWAAFVLMK